MVEFVALKQRKVLFRNFHAGCYTCTYLSIHVGCSLFTTLLVNISDVSTSMVVLKKMKKLMRQPKWMALCLTFGSKWESIGLITTYKLVQCLKQCKSWNENVVFQEKQTSNLAGGLVWNMMNLLVKMTAGKQIFLDHCFLPGRFFYVLIIMFY